jgi:hypothetical protein
MPQVTLVAIDTRAPTLAAQSLQRSSAGIDFARLVLFSHGVERATLASDIELADIGPIGSGAEYSHFVVRRLPEHVATPFALVTQWDGFVVDPAQWRDEFLEFDCLGAPWHDQPEARCVGNGGFLLRSQRLLHSGRDLRVSPEHPEDQALCRDHRDPLEREHGVRFAPPWLARRFAFENFRPVAPTFGFHWPHQLPASSTRRRSPAGWKRCPTRATAAATHAAWRGRCCVPAWLRRPCACSTGAAAPAAASRTRCCSAAPPWCWRAGAGRDVGVLSERPEAVPHVGGCRRRSNGGCRGPRRGAGWS